MPADRGAAEAISSDSSSEIDRRSDRHVWTDGGCTAYYTDDDGRNYAIYPGFAAEFRRRTQRFDPDAYKLAA